MVQIQNLTASQVEADITYLFSQWDNTIINHHQRHLRHRLISTKYRCCVSGTCLQWTTTGGASGAFAGWSSRISSIMSSSDGTHLGIPRSGNSV